MITLVTKRLPATPPHRHLTKDKSKPRRSGGLVKLRRAVLVRSEDEDDLSGQGPLDSIESLFSKELKKRGINNAETNADAGAATSADPLKAKTATQTRPPPAWVEEDVDDQLSKSRQLNSEGLEGLFPRATQLFQLGGSLFLSFLPFLLGISLLFGGIFLVLGDKFVHYGRPGSGAPRYIDPDLLLNEPSVDPYIPFESRMRPMDGL